MTYDLRRAAAAVLGAGFAFAGLTGSMAHADEGGVSFWLPGQNGSFAAVAPDPGFSLPTITYYYTGKAGADVPLERGEELEFGVSGQFLGQFIVPSYAPDVKILGAKPNFSLAFLPAYTKGAAEAQLKPLSASVSEVTTGFSDLYPTAQLFWNSGVHNWMAYVTGNIPVGTYDADSLANIGIGHGAVDIGGAYTYLDPVSGWEFSATAGLTFNFENTHTHYTNGIDGHLDAGAAKFLNEQFFVGAVGFLYQQLTADDGQPAILGEFKSSSIGVGPQIGYFFNAGGVPVYTNLRGYYEIDAENRTKGGSVMLTLNLPLSAFGQ